MVNFLKNSPMHIFANICPVRDELFYTDRQTDVTKPIASFGCFVLKAPNTRCTK